ncbi:hypothetical protein N9L68_04230 [bacterium]|nr:hypothetical protein [bacterium]
MPFRQEDPPDNKEDIKREEMNNVEIRGSKRPPWERPLLPIRGGEAILRSWLHLREKDARIALLTRSETTGMTSSQTCPELLHSPEHTVSGYERGHRIPRGKKEKQNC